MNTLRGLRDFIIRGNVVDLAIGVMIGAAFNGVISTLVRDLMTPLVAALFQQPDFSKLAFMLRGSQFAYGDFLNNLISFLITAITIYFFIVVPVNRLNQRFHKGSPPSPMTKSCPECLSDIPVGAKRCKFCTVELQKPSSVE